jgi:hypothetical protein
MDQQQISNIVSSAISANLPAANLSAAFVGQVGEDYQFTVSPMPFTTGNSTTGPIPPPATTWYVITTPILTTMGGAAQNGMWLPPSPAPLPIDSPVPMTPEQLQQLYEMLKQPVIIGDKELERAAKQELQREPTQEEMDEIKRMILDRRDNGERIL